MFYRVESISAFIKQFPISAFLIFLQLFIYILIKMPFLPHDSIIEKLAGVNLYIAQGELWRLLTPIFLHISFMHLLFNSISISLFGPFVEHFLGKLRFSLYFLLCGITANAATYYIQPPSYVHTGSSGAAFGLLGFYLAAAFIQKRTAQSRSYEKMILVTAIMPILMVFQYRSNFAAHITGFITGLLIGWICWRKNSKKLDQRPFL